MLKQTLVATALAATALLSGPALAEPAKFDGTWTVQLVTSSGICDASTSSVLTVRNGQVRAAGAGVSVSGQIGANGAISLALQKGPAQGSASGKLSSGSGSGTWTVSTVGCSGRWTARRATQTAQAL